MSGESIMVTKAPATMTPIASVSPEAKREAQQRATNLRNLTKTITQNLEKWFGQFQEIWDNRDWEKLGYNDWDHYCQEEITRIRLAPEIELGVIEMMRKWGMSQRDVAAATGLSQSTVFNRIKALTSAGVQLPKQIKSRQGKQVKAEKPEGKAREGGRVRKEDRKPKPELPAPVSTDAPPEIPPPAPTNGTTHGGTPIHDIVSDAASYATANDDAIVTPRVTIQGEATQVTLDEIRDNLKAAQELKDSIAAELTPDNVTLEYATMLNQHASWIHHWANDILNMINPDSQADTDTESMKWNHSGSVPFQSEDDMISPDL